MGISKLAKSVSKLVSSDKKFNCTKVFNKSKFDERLFNKDSIKKMKPFDASISVAKRKSKACTIYDRSAQSMFRESVMDFAVMKKRLISELSGVCDKNTIDRLKKADSPEKLAKILAQQEFKPLAKSDKLMKDLGFIDKKIRGKQLKPFTLSLEQQVKAVRDKHVNFILARERALHVTSKNPKVIAIENILKEQYGCKFVALKDEEELARKVLKAFDVAKKNGIKTPHSVIASDATMPEGENLHNGTIVLKRKPRELLKGYTSTEADYHTVLHEIMHGTHPTLISFSLKKIPSQFKNVKDNLSIYSQVSFTHETFTELNTKRLINGLNKEEQALYDYLNIFG